MNYIYQNSIRARHKTLYRMYQEFAIRTYLEQCYPHFEEALKKEITIHGSLAEYKAGKVFSSMQPGSQSVLLLVHGNLKIYKLCSDGNTLYLYMLGPGEICAVTYFDAQLRLTGISMNEVVVIHVPNKILPGLAHFHSWNTFIHESSADKFCRLVDVIEIVATCKLPERLEGYIRYHLKRLGGNILKVSHKEIADDLNSSREVISRLLKRMENEGKVRSHRYSIEWTGGF